MPARKDLDLTTFSGRFAARMLELRLAAGLSQEEAAERIGVAWSTIFAWESARTQPKISQLPSIAKAYGVKESEIIP